MSVAFDTATTTIPAAREDATAAASTPATTAAAAAAAAAPSSAAAPALHRMPTLSACARYEEHLWKKDICKQCGRIKDKHTAAALRPVTAEATHHIWYVRPSEIMRQQGRKVSVPHCAPPPVDLSNDTRSLAANAAKPAEPAGAGIGGAESKPQAMLSPPRHAHVVSEVDAMSPVARRDSTHSRYPKSLASLPSRSLVSESTAAESTAVQDDAASPTSADSAQNSSTSSAASPQPHARVSSNSTPIVAPVAVNSPALVAPVPLAISLTMLDGQTVSPVAHDEFEVSQYDGSVSSSIVDHARSPAPVLRHEGGGRSLGEYNHPDDEPFSLERYDSEQSDSGPSDSDETDDSTESGMSPDQIQALLSRLTPTAAQATLAAAAAAQNPDGSAATTKRGPKKSILVVRRRSSTRSAGTAAASSGSSSAHRPRRKHKSVSFNSCVMIREYGRVQGGSTSVTRSGQYSLGLDWSVQRELMAPLELSIETIAEKRRQQRERLEAQSESDVAAAAALAEPLPSDDDDEQLLTEPDPEYDEDGNLLPEDSATMFAGIRSPAGSTASLASVPVIDDVLSADASASAFDDITIAAYKLQPLKLHKRYPSNNKDEEMQRISEEGRVRLFQRYVQVEESTSPVDALAAAAAAEATPESPASDSFDADAAALRSVLADPRVFDESSELESIRDSRGANFCTCHPPKGRLGAMLMNLTDSEIADLPLSEGNTCCSDDSCACFRAGVGCHVESDHYCLCAGSFVERIRASRKQTEEEQEQEEEEEEDFDDDRPIPLAQAGCLNPAGRYQFDERAGREHASRYLYGDDPYDAMLREDAEAAGIELTESLLSPGKFLSSPPVRFARARTPSALPSFFAQAQAYADAVAASQSPSAAGSSVTLLAGLPTPSRKTFKPNLGTLTEK